MSEDSLPPVPPSGPPSQHSSRPSSATQLRPLRSSVSSVSTAEDSEVDASLEMKKKEPLPPIPGGDQKPTAGSSRSSVSSVGQRPRIVSYRRESATDSESVKSTDSQPTVANKAHSVGRSVECQTEWSWVEDMRTVQQMRTSTPATSRATSKSAVVVDDQWDEETEGGATGAASSTQATPTQATPTQETTTESVADGEELALGDTYPPVDDAFGIPILHLDSDSGSSDEDSLYMYQCDTSQPELEKQGTLASVGPPEILKYQKESTHPELDSRSSPDTPAGGHVPLDGRLATPQFMSDAEGSDGAFGGQCEFCQKSIKKFPTSEEQKTLPPETLYCCEEYREFVDYIQTHPLVKQEPENVKIDVKPHPPYGSKQARRAARERASERMREREVQKQQAAIVVGASAGLHGMGGVGETSSFHQLSTTGLKQREGSTTDTIGSKASSGRSRQQPLLSISRGSQEITEATGEKSHKPKVLGNSLSAQLKSMGLFNVARQMKTINYQLSSQRCLEEGWTLRPPSPLMDEGDEETFEQSPRLNADARGKAAQMVLKYYKDGSKYIILFPDGSGHVFYPSGRVALTITTSEEGLHTYIAQSDTEDCRVLAVVEPSGRMATYYSTGDIRVYLDRVGGIELTSGGAKKRRWTWQEGEEHVHAPPIQPLTQALSPHLALRILNQHNITLTFTAKKKSCRFQVGAQVKLSGVEPPTEVDKDEVFRRECQARIDGLLVKVNNLLRFPNSSRTTQSAQLSKLKGQNNVKGQNRDDKQTRSSTVLTVN